MKDLKREIKEVQDQILAVRNTACELLFEGLLSLFDEYPEISLKVRIDDYGIFEKVEYYNTNELNLGNKTDIEINNYLSELSFACEVGSQIGFKIIDLNKGNLDDLSILFDVDMNKVRSKFEQEKLHDGVGLVTQNTRRYL